MSSQMQIAFALACLFGQVVACRGFATADLTRTALFKTLLGTAVTLHFRHKKLLSKSQWPDHRENPVQFCDLGAKIITILRPSSRAGDST